MPVICSIYVIAVPAGQLGFSNLCDRVTFLMPVWRPLFANHRYTLATYMIVRHDPGGRTANLECCEAIDVSDKPGSHPSGTGICPLPKTGLGLQATRVGVGQQAAEAWDAAKPLNHRTAHRTSGLPARRPAAAAQVRRNARVQKHLASRTLSSRVYAVKTAGRAGHAPILCAHRPVCNPASDIAPPLHPTPT